MKPRLRIISGRRIDTERLILRAPDLADAPRVSALLGTWEVARWLVRIPYPYRTEHAEAWIERAGEERAAGTGWPFLILRRDDETLMGSIDLSLESDNVSGALGYWLGQDYWGLGYATEAARAVVEFAFDVLVLGLVNASALPDNDRSMRVLEKAGLVHIDRRAEDTIERGRVDTEFFALDQPTWRLAK